MPRVLGFMCTSGNVSGDSFVEADGTDGVLLLRAPSYATPKPSTVTMTLAPADRLDALLVMVRVHAKLLGKERTSDLEALICAELEARKQR